MVADWYLNHLQQALVGNHSATLEKKQIPVSKPVEKPIEKPAAVKAEVVSKLAKQPPPVIVKPSAPKSSSLEDEATNYIDMLLAKASIPNLEKSDPEAKVAENYVDTLFANVNYL